MNKQTAPLLVTFDGEARSGKGTIVQKTKDFLRDEYGYKVMLIDRGQTFRVLVVAAVRAGVNLDKPADIDAYLADDTNSTTCAQFVKDVYHMAKEERDALLYTNEVGANSAKVGARPASQEFVKVLTKKWLKDAGNDGFEVVLIDGRALESIAREMQNESLCNYKLGLYFTCDAVMGARRTLGYAATQYADLNTDQKTEVDDFVKQIHERNRRDYERAVERLAPPQDAPVYKLPTVPETVDNNDVPMMIIDTSAELTKDAMSMPVAKLVAQVLES